ncbi:hypothetical protein SV7mr_35440 [Stieleria bergensis]|uniref:Uncharacterized protein n=1 Tax=Stieleria bergensis TaxID=2528025 RepID=A0A517SXZ5_9BACT|nr:hypothetical protein SV7mr_35440 [Planctomycetes bacterium SV_7m_r]
MNIQSFLEAHGIVRNPFAEEDAQTDQVFKEHCITNAYHPVWDKVYGDPKEPSTAIVCGPKGSGKTAMRLQIRRQLEQYNRENPDQRVFLIPYDDFNPFLDHFSQRLSKRTNRKPERVLAGWKLWDHMDAILCLATTRVVDRILRPEDYSDGFSRNDLTKLDRTASRDLLMLAACYDQSSEGAFVDRWNRLRRALGYRNVQAKVSCWAAIAWCVLTLAISTYLLIAWGVNGGEEGSKTIWDYLWAVPFIMFAGSAPYLLRLLKTSWLTWKIRRHMRVGRRDFGSLRKLLHAIPGKELAGQPLPRYSSTDDRYELLNKFQLLLNRLGYRGICVLMDRVDEPHLTGGKAELMRLFVWPLLDNKLLKHPGIGFKMMLPQELHRAMERETPEFHERARLDKQNLVPAFQWTGESLYDLARARMIACSDPNQMDNVGALEPKNLFADVEYARLISAFNDLRVPRHLFRFLYRVLVEHCNSYTDADPQFKIRSQVFETALAVYMKEVDG